MSKYTINIDTELSEGLVEISNLSDNAIQSKNLERIFYVNQDENYFSCILSLPENLISSRVIKKVNVYQNESGISETITESTAFKMSDSEYKIEINNICGDINISIELAKIGSIDVKDYIEVDINIIISYDEVSEELILNEEYISYDENTEELTINK